MHLTYVNRSQDKQIYDFDVSSVCLDVDDSGICISIANQVNVVFAFDFDTVDEALQIMQQIVDKVATPKRYMLIESYGNYEFKDYNSRDLHF